MGIETIRIQNFKSIKDSGDIKIQPINILIGANGVGKSNFISFFKFLSKIYQQQLQLYVGQNGRANNFLHFGRKKSEFIGGEIVFNNEWKNEYVFELVPTQSDNFIFSKEQSNFHQPKQDKNTLRYGDGHEESLIKNDDGFRNKHLKTHLGSFKIFHFHDTSAEAHVKQFCNSTDYAFFREDGGNLAAFLYRLQEKKPTYFTMIERMIRSIAPFFNSFYLQPDEINENQIQLRWLENGSDQVFNAHNLSDGTLRMMCLTTLLLQPNPPETIIIDEPELGLHPFAIQKLAAMLQNASTDAQIIISTQSVDLINHFSANDIIVVERQKNESVFRRLDENNLSEWLEDYSLGDLWEKNILGGRP